MNEIGDVLGGQRDCARIGGAADEAGEQGVALRGTVWEERGIPDGAESAEFFGARDEVTEAIQRVANGGFWITEGNDSDRGKLDSVQPEFFNGFTRTFQ